VNLVILIAAATLQTSAAPPAVDPADPKLSVIQAARWVKKPSSDDVAHAYPLSAAARALEDHVTMRCIVKADGRLSKCKVIKDERPGFDFDNATLSLARLFKMETTSSDGKSMVGGVVIIPVYFNNGQSLYSLSTQ
jgi:TonB family protein